MPYAGSLTLARDSRRRIRLRLEMRGMGSAEPYPRSCLFPQEAILTLGSP